MPKRTWTTPDVALLIAAVMVFFLLQRTTGWGASLAAVVTFAAFVPVGAVYCFGPVWVLRWKQRRRSGA